MGECHVRRPFKRVLIEVYGIPLIAIKAAMNGARIVLDPTRWTNRLIQRLRRGDTHFFEAEWQRVQTFCQNAVGGDFRHEIPAAGAFVASGGPHVTLQTAEKSHCNALACNGNLNPVILRHFD